VSADEVRMMHAWKNELDSALQQLKHAMTCSIFNLSVLATDVGCVSEIYQRYVELQRTNAQGMNAP
jgi:hypothetical protein